MKYLFFVQGEGRGHMTQAIALSAMLRKNGHTVSAALVGKNPQRQIPEFVFEKIGTKVIPFESPNFVIDDKTKGIKITQTLTYNLYHHRRFLNSLDFVHKVVEEHQPDVIINFYDLLAGLYFKFYKVPATKICVGHQQLIEHPEFEFPKGFAKKKDIAALKLNTYISSMNADKKLGLSFRKMNSKNNVRVVPPLLRQEVLEQQPTNSGRILAYLNNNGFATEIIAWQKLHPEIEIDCFWDKKDAETVWSPQPNLTFHRLDDVKFLNKMASCKAYTSTAGFESICEAMYLGKPVMMVPIHNHIEQECNAIDGVKSGAGISSTFFDLDRFVDYIPKHKNAENFAFREWVHSAEEVFLKELTS